MRFFIGYSGKPAEGRTSMNTEKPAHPDRDRALAPLRKQIDTIDAQILELINQRLDIGRQVGRIKQEKGGAVLDREREKKVIENLFALNRGPASRDLLQYIFNVIITATREIQKPKKISFLGPEAGLTHMAALTHFKHSGNFICQPGLNDVFKEVEKNESRFGVVPVENSIEGAVNHTLDLFAVYTLQICAEHYEPVSYDLLSMTGDPSHVKTIYGHHQAVAQCKGWLRKKFSNTPVKETGSTALAARAVASDPDGAVIASGKAAHIYELLPVETSIEDHAGNITRFLVIGKDMPPPTGKDKTSIMFAASHVPGALFKALEPVNQAGLNMLKLESRPTRNQNWSYYFFMDIEGHIQDPVVSHTIEQLKSVCLSLRVLGSYPMDSESGIQTLG